MPANQSLPGAGDTLLILNCRVCARSGWADWNVGPIYTCVLHSVLNDSQHLCYFNKRCHWRRRSLLYPSHFMCFVQCYLHCLRFVSMN